MTFDRQKEESPETIVIVDDTADNLVVLKKVLQRGLADTRIELFQDPEEALAFLHNTTTVSLAIIDLQMPGMDGLELCRRLKASDRTKSVQILLITSRNADASLKARGLDAGADDFLLRPLDNIELIARIKAVLRVARAESMLRKIAAEANQDKSESEKLLLTIAMNFPNSYLSIINADYTIGFTSGLEFKKRNIDPEQFVGLHISQVFGEQTTIVQQHYRKVFEGHEVEFEIFITKQYQHYHVVPLFDDNGSVPRILAVAENITERKLAEKSLRESEERLRNTQKLEAVGLLAGGIAHDFNNILGSMLLNLELGQMKLERTHPAVIHFEEAHTAIVNATNLTKQLLTFARGGDPILKAVNIDHLIRQTTIFNLRGSNVKAYFELPDDLWPVVADQGQMVQVLANLIINAKQAMPEGGNIFVSAANLDNCQTSPECAGADRCVRICIRDEGTGIHETMLDRIFDPYFTTKESGSGLGLATTHSIVNKHKGSITAQSDGLSGTTFTIHLPACQNAQPANATQQGNKNRTAMPHLHCLIMDDNARVAKALLLLLEASGCPSETVEDGKAALTKYVQAKKSDQPFDLVIMDLTIPGGMGGKQSMAELLKIDPEAKVIVASGYSTDPVLANYADYGFVGRLVKPFSARDLHQELWRIFADA